MELKWRVLIIDDEPAARRIIVRMMEDYKDSLHLAGEADNGAIAIQMINDIKPDLLFLDIYLQDMTGFEVLQNIRCQPSIIFTTAYDQYAIKAFEEMAIDYLLKPIREERFKASILKLQTLGNRSAKYELESLNKLIEKIHVKKTWTAFPVKIGEKIILIPFETIAYLEADDKYVKIFTDTGVKYLTDIPLNKLVDKFPPEFIRIQKSYIINKTKIKELHKHFNGRFIFIMNDKAFSRIQSGNTYYDFIKTEFGF
jgi:two-component system LytT family response regulator